MLLSSQWFVAQAVSSIRHGVGSRVAFDVVRRARRWLAATSSETDATTHGFAITVRSAPCIAVEDAVGCTAKVLKGRAWITAEGSPHDTIVDAGSTFTLERGVRFNVSAFGDAATLLITAPSRLAHVGFSLHRRAGMRVLTVTSGRSRLPAMLTGSPAAIAAFARRCFADPRSAAA